MPEPPVVKQLFEAKEVEKDKLSSEKEKYHISSDKVTLVPFNTNRIPRSQTLFTEQKRTEQNKKKKKKKT